MLFRSSFLKSLLFLYVLTMSLTGCQDNQVVVTADIVGSWQLYRYAHTTDHMPDIENSQIFMHFTEDGIMYQTRPEGKTENVSYQLRIENESTVLYYYSESSGEYYQEATIEIIDDELTLHPNVSHQLGIMAGGCVIPVSKVYRKVIGRCGFGELNK